MQNKLLTLIVVQDGTRVLLGLKKRGFGKGRWNGFGGKVEKGESIEKGARRELREEAGIGLKHLAPAGILYFTFGDDPEVLEVHVFRGEGILGLPTETDEMRPAWYEAQDIPYADMWPDDIHWFPLFLAGKKFRGKFVFGKGDIILNQELTVVDSI